MREEGSGPLWNSPCYVDFLPITTMRMNLPSGMVFASGISIDKPRSVAKFVLGMRPGETAMTVHEGSSRRQFNAPSSCTNFDALYTVLTPALEFALRSTSSVANTAWVSQRNRGGT